jgi:hypothetical protein
MQSRQAGAVGDQGSDMLLLYEPPAAHVAHIEGVYLLTGDLCVLNRQDPCLGDHVAQGRVPSLPELGATYTNNRYRPHILSLPLCLAYIA